MTASHGLPQLLESDRTGPCVTIYQPTHRSFPDNQQDPIRFKNLLKEVESSFGDQARSEAAQGILAQLRSLADDADFWNHAQDGLAVFAAPDFFRTFRLQREVIQLALVAESFHVKPMLRIVQSAGRFHVLALNRRTVRLFEGNRDALDEIPLANAVPSSIDNALQNEGQALEQGQDGAEASGGAGERVSTRAGIKSGGVHRSHNDTKDTANLEVERFFRAVDRAVIEHHSKPSGLPLVLAALPEYHEPFRSLSHNRQLAPKGIEINPEALSADELRKRAWELILPEYEARLAALVDRFGAARGTGLATDGLEEVAKAAVSGRVDTLLLDASKKVPGRLDREKGSIRRDAIDNPEIDDVLDDLAECVLSNGGDVVIVPSERMPSQSGLAAIFRY